MASVLGIVHDFDDVYSKLPLTEIECAQKSTDDISPILERLDPLRAMAIDLAGSVATGPSACHPDITLVPVCL